VVDTAFMRTSSVARPCPILVAAALAGAERINLTIAKAQLRAFTRWRCTWH
jgi:hypothetical protein